MGRFLQSIERWLRDLVIRKKIFFLTLSLTLALSLAMSAALYRLASRTLHQSLQSRLKHVAATAALFLDGDRVERVRSENDRGGADWKALAAQLEAVQAANKLRFVYVMRRSPKEGRAEFVVDPSVDKPTKVGQDYDASRLPALLEGFERPAVDADVVEDEFGATMSGYAPVRRKDGSGAGLVGLDMDAAEVVRLRNKFLSFTLGMVVFFLFVSLAASAVFAQLLTRPIVAMRDRVRLITGGRLETRMPDASQDELGQLSHSINRMVDTLSHYLPVKLVGQILGTEADLKLGGSRMPVTAFFSDIAGFTTISEKLSPEDTVSLLNEYLTAMTDDIEEASGTVDKFEGDAIVAYWGAPLPQPDHARLACEAALRQIEAGERLRERWRQEGKPDIVFRVGLNSGDVLAGNMGSQRRFNYTIMGDVVNLASRLESANKNYGSRVLVGEATRAAARDEFEFRELDRIRVVGKTVAVTVYELLGRKGRVSREALERRDSFERALAAYRARKWDDAEAGFKKLADKASELYQSRITKAREVPPPASWDGSHDLRSK